MFKTGDVVKDKKNRKYEILKRTLTGDYKCVRIEDGELGTKQESELTFLREMPKKMRKEPYQQITPKQVGFTILAIVILLFSAASIYTINAGQRGVLLTFGEAEMKSIEPGLHFKFPIAQKVIKMEVRTIKFTAPASAASKDLQVVSTTVEPNFHIDPERVAEVYSDVGLGYAERIIYPVVQETVKASTALFTAEELITKRPEVKLKIEEGIRQNLNKRGIILEQVSITNFDFSESFNLAIEQKVKAEQLKLTAERDLERIKIEALQVEEAAIGVKKATIAKAEGDNEAKILNAEAESLGIGIIQEQLAKSPKYIEWLTATNWDGHLPKVTGGAIPMIDVTTELN